MVAVGWEQYSDKVVVKIGMAFSVAGGEIQVPQDSPLSSVKNAVDYVGNQGNSFTLHFADGSLAKWKWNRDKQAFLPWIN